MVLQERCEEAGWALEGKDQLREVPGREEMGGHRPPSHLLVQDSSWEPSVALSTKKIMTPCLPHLIQNKKETSLKNTWMAVPQSFCFLQNGHFNMFFNVKFFPKKMFPLIFWYPCFAGP